MGYEDKTITVTATVSRHNSDQDRYDDAAVETLREKIAEAVDETTRAHPNAFQRLVPQVWGP